MNFHPPASRTYRILTIFCLSALLFTSCLTRESQKIESYSSPYYLQHGGLTLGILPEVGGLVVYLADETRQNLLLSDSSLWVQDAAALPRMTTHYSPRPYNGHTVWLGPQSDWWTQQQLDPSMRRKKAMWPPDPYLTFGRYTILSSTDSSILLQSPVSPVSGVRLTKEITLITENRVRFTSGIENMRTEDCSWDIWTNTRLNGFARAYVPLAGIDNILRVTGRQGKTNQSMGYTFQDGFISNFPQIPSAGREKRSIKLFLDPEYPMIAAFTKDHLFIKRFPAQDPSLVHPRQATIEIYNCISRDSTENVLELEHHSAFRTLKHSEKHSETEEWEVIRLHEKVQRKDEASFLRKLIISR